ncbi:MAG TPA: thioredoxin family protein [Terriglobales bacterium]|nr:thioredoxin family protein [Terriglobales bacterium]
MDLLNQEIRDATRKKLEAEMAGNVRLLLFTQEPRLLVLPGEVPGQECLYCRETRRLVEELKALSDKIELEVADFVARKDLAAQYGVDKIPALLVLGAKPNGIRFYGIPSGYEYTSLVEAVVDVSRGATGLGEKTKESLAALNGDVHVQVFVTPTCPYCTVAVRLGHQMAVESPHVRCDMIEATEFPHLVQKYGVYGVPRTLFNDAASLDGAVAEDAFLAQVLEAAAAAVKA